MLDLLLLSVLAAAGGAKEVRCPITVEAVGPITAATKLSTENIERLFRGARVEHFETEGIGGFKDRGQGWNVWLNGKEMALTIVSHANGARAVNVLGSTPATPEGLRVGSTVEDLAASGPLRCRRSPEEEREVLACARLQAPNVEFFFVPTAAEVETLRSAKEQSVTAFVPELGGRRTIVMIVWRPPRVEADSDGRP